MTLNDLQQNIPKSTNMYDFCKTFFILCLKSGGHLVFGPENPKLRIYKYNFQIQLHLLCEHQNRQSYTKNIANFSKMKQLVSSKRAAIFDFGEVENFMFFAMILDICVLKIMQNGKAVLTIWPIMYKIRDG